MTNTECHRSTYWPNISLLRRYTSVEIKTAHEWSTLTFSIL